MAEGSFVAYYRVSTDRQGKSGLGLEAQKEAVCQYLNDGQWRLLAEFTEVESGKRNDRQELARAMQACRVYGAKLVIAKLDRLSRDAHFLMGLQKSGVPFIAVDMPHADQFTVGIMALVAEKEREMISSRTKAALAAAKARGVQLGGDRGVVLDEATREKGREARTAQANGRASDLFTVIRSVQIEQPGLSLSAVAKALTERGVPTPSGKTHWQAVQVQRVLKRAG